MYYPIISRLSAEAALAFVLLSFFLLVILVLALRWFNYRERMAIIHQGGQHQHELVSYDSRCEKASLARSIMTTMVGLSITISLLTIGIGPWLIIGMIPLFVGLAMLIAYRIMREKPVDPQPQLPCPQDTPPTEELVSDEHQDEQDHDLDQTLDITEDKKEQG